MFSGGDCNKYGSSSEHRNLNIHKWEVGSETGSKAQKQKERYIVVWTLKMGSGESRKINFAYNPEILSEMRRKNRAWSRLCLPRKLKHTWNDDNPKTTLNVNWNPLWKFNQRCRNGPKSSKCKFRLFGWPQNTGNRLIVLAHRWITVNWLGNISHETVL